MEDQCQRNGKERLDVPPFPSPSLSCDAGIEPRASRTLGKCSNTELHTDLPHTASSVVCKTILDTFKSLIQTHRSIELLPENQEADHVIQTLASMSLYTSKQKNWDLSFQSRSREETEICNKHAAPTLK